MDDYTRDDFRVMPWTLDKCFTMATMLLDMREAIIDAREDSHDPKLIELGALVKATYDLLKAQIDAANKAED